MQYSTSSTASYHVIHTAGQYVEVVDATDKLLGNIGCVAFFVGDNIYVKFSRLRWSPTRMFFADQLRLCVAPQPHVVKRPVVLRKLKISLHKAPLGHSSSPKPKAAQTSQQRPV